MKIKSKLLISFLLAMALPVIVISFIIFSGFQNMLTDVIYKNLGASARLKAGVINSFYEELRSDIVIAQDYFNIKNNLPILIRLGNNKNSSEYIKAKQTLDSQMQTLQRVKNFSDMMLTDLDGKIVYVSDPLHGEIDIGRNISEFGDIFSGFDAEKIFISDIFKNILPGKDYNYGAIAYGPARDLSGKIIGGIIFEINSQHLYNSLTEENLLGKSAETIIGKRSGPDEITYISPLYKSSKAPFEFKLSIKDNPTLPLVSALETRISGEGIVSDYNGDEVIAHWEYLPARNWGLVVKMDTSEAFRDINYLRYIIFFSLNALFVLISLITFRIAKTISEPIEELHRGADIVTSGNLDYKVDIKTKDEIGELATAFNMMTEKIKNSNEMLSEEVKMRTRELDEKLTELEKMNSFMVNRELKMAELKKEIAMLQGKADKK